MHDDNPLHGFALHGLGSEHTSGVPDQSPVCRQYRIESPLGTDGEMQVSEHAAPVTFDEQEIASALSGTTMGTQVTTHLPPKSTEDAGQDPEHTPEVHISLMVVDSPSSHGVPLAALPHCESALAKGRTINSKPHDTSRSSHIDDSLSVIA